MPGQLLDIAQAAAGYASGHVPSARAEVECPRRLLLAERRDRKNEAVQRVLYLYRGGVPQAFSW